MELVKETCMSLVDPCVSRTHKSYKLKPFFASNDEFRKNYYSGSLESFVSEKAAKLLHSKKEELAEVYTSINKVNSAISLDIVRGFDRTTKEFIGYIDLWENKFVSLKFLPIDAAKRSKNDVRPNFEVHEVLGFDPVVRLKNVPDELPGHIIGGPIKKLTEKNEVVKKIEEKLPNNTEKGVVESVENTLPDNVLKNHNIALESNSIRWWLWLLGILSVLSIIFLLRRVINKKT